jgi:O-antigen ligase
MSVSVEQNSPELPSKPGVLLQLKRSFPEIFEPLRFSHFWITLLFIAGTVMAAPVIAWLIPRYGEQTIFTVLVGAGISILMVQRPAIGIYLLGLTSAFENLTTLQTGATGVKMLGIAVFGAWILRKLFYRESFITVISARVLAPTLLFMAYCFVSLLWAPLNDYRLTEKLVDGFFTPFQLLALALLMMDVLKTWEHLERAAGFLVLGGNITAIFTITQYVAQGARRAGANVVGDPNGTAQYLTVIIPFAFYLFNHSKSRLWRLVGLVFIAAGPIATLLTFSRTSYIFLVITLVLQLWYMARGGIQNQLRVAVIGLVAVVTLFGTGLVPWESVIQRGSTVSSYIESGDQRVHIWKTAVLIFEDYPLLGTGYSSFGHFFEKYQFRASGGTYAWYGRYRSPHSTVLGFLAELGLVGISLWIWLNFTVLRNLLLSWFRSFKVQGKAHTPFIWATFLNLFVQMLFGLVSIIYSLKVFWLAIGFSEVIYKLTKEAETAAATTSAQTGGKSADMTRL